MHQKTVTFSYYLTYLVNTDQVTVTMAEKKDVPKIRVSEEIQISHLKKFGLLGQESPRWACGQARADR